ncbi:hypothetical protein OU426_09600 [Frigidibacter sp. RF13]|uniref:hypothetical protein n=1 Tax=Frigidibacter sp. RF13 TaxID=2997340 RepID=UPI002270B8CB|nr:hypothetical protein [Frigidibacter sp. RF13]MCY1127109.1 hypothetical protein [Frigidibacter sp. RF13]
MAPADKTKKRPKGGDRALAAGPVDVSDGTTVNSAELGHLSTVPALSADVERVVENHAIPFRIQPNFWDSSTHTDFVDWAEVVEVPQYPIADLLAELSPTAIVCDIGAAEMGAFDAADLGTVRTLSLKVHPKGYGTPHATWIHALLNVRGFRLAPGNDPSGVGRHFEREA